MVSFQFVMRRRKMFGIIVSFVSGAGSPIKMKLFVGNSVTEPMITHVKSFGAFHTNLGLKDIIGSRIVSFEGGAGGRLGMAHLGESSDERNGFLCIEEEATSLGFGGRGRNAAKSLAKDMNGTIGVRNGRISGR